MSSEITYDQTLVDKAGCVEINDKNMRPQDSKTLLHFLFWLLYTADGRRLLKTNEPEANGQLPADKRQNVLNKCIEYGITSPDLQNAIIDAHINGHNWTVAFKGGAPKQSDLIAAEKVYLQKLSFIMWSLWEDAKGHEFSLAW